MWIIENANWWFVGAIYFVAMVITLGHETPNNLNLALDHVLDKFIWSTTYTDIKRFGPSDSGTAVGRLAWIRERMSNQVEEVREIAWSKSVILWPVYWVARWIKSKPAWTY